VNLTSLRDRAVRLYQQGDLLGAEQCCIAILRTTPDCAIIHNLRGTIFLHRNRPMDALVALDNALAIKPRYVEALTNRGTALRQLNRLEEALLCYERAVAIKPSDPVVLNNRGTVLSDLGHLERALDSYDMAILRQPNYASALNNRGNALRKLKRFDAALASFERAVAIMPDSSEVKFNRGLTLLDLCRFREAVVSFNDVLSAQPRDMAALFHRGAALFRVGQPLDALANYEKALEIEPNFIEAMNDHGTVLLSLRRFDEALAGFDRVLAIEPSHFSALSNRGAALQGLNRSEEALAALDRALAIEPRSSATLYNRGSILQRLGHNKEALVNYEAALAIDLNDGGAWNNRGGVLQSLERFDDALASYDRAVAIKPGYAEAWFNRGSLLRLLKCPDEARRSYDRALAINSDLVGALSSRANLLWVTYGDYEGALRDLERAAIIDPDYPYLRGDLLHLRMYGARWHDFDRQVSALDEAVRAGKRAVTPFVYQVISQSPRDLQSCAVLYNNDRYPAAHCVVPATSPHDKIRVGYVSGEFRQQATSFLAAGLYERHDRERFDIVAFDSGGSDGSSMRARLEAAFDNFVDISALPDGAAAARIRAENIDILVNLNGYFGAARMGVFAHRPAPIQVNYLGFPGTLGADYIDYIIADRIVIPESERAFYNEQVAYLPDCYQVNDSKRAIGKDDRSRSEWDLPETRFVFCNFNQSYKLIPPMFTTWMRILDQIEGSTLWLLESNKDVSRHLRQEAERHCVAGERLVFAPLVAVEEHLARHRHADLFLDSIPCNAHTTASDALWAGLPVVTCRGTTFAGRVATSLLHAIGLPELVADDLAQYVALCVNLARDPASLKTVREILWRNRRTAPLFDTDRYRRNIEAAYTAMWEAHRGGAKPRGFSV
jgi:protein O-GlcNAc transferase